MADGRLLDRPDAPHTVHDLLLVAAFAAGDADATDRPRAEALVAACAECATLVSDLRAIAVATAALPAPRRPRDFSLRPADAERLRSHRFGRLVGPAGGPRMRLARPLAGGLMMLGLAGLIVASLPGVALLGAPASTDQRLEMVASPAPGSDTQGASNPYPTSVPAATDGTVVDLRGAGGAGGSPAASTPAEAAGPTPTGDSAVGGAPRGRDGEATGPSPLVIGSVALIALGGVLLVVPALRTGRRRT